ncbi:hypothetical protein B7Y94_00005 [Candidatus Saccharibacteria bacterium 32-49-12]|nr:MAG: hypothetical protein B7Y94_00005 [Candidatus Saccharibacteria bacterium 32-49-12]
MSKKSPKKNKQQRRTMLAFMRIFRYGISNFSRNVWLTVAATAVMAVTLLIVMITLVSRNVLLETVSDISKSVDMSIYLRGDAAEEDILEVKDRVESLSNVESVRYISAAQAREDQAQQNKDDPAILEAIREASNRMSATLRVSLTDINDTASLDEFTQKDGLYQQIKDPSKSPSFQGERRAAISSIGEWVKLAEVGGGTMTAVFVIISSLVVFNTIRMAIFNRKDEIYMMKLIGAGKEFIRGPFLVEAVMYGVIAAVVATAAGFGLVMAARQPLAQYGLPIENTLASMAESVGLILVGMILLGSLIGVVSSYIATRKHLRV